MKVGNLKHVKYICKGEIFDDVDIGYGRAYFVTTLSGRWASREDDGISWIRVPKSRRIYNKRKINYYRMEKEIRDMLKTYEWMFVDPLSWKNEDGERIITMPVAPMIQPEEVFLDGQ